MKRFKVIVYSPVSRCKYTYYGKFSSIQEAISYYSGREGTSSRVVEIKEMGVRL